MRKMKTNNLKNISLKEVKNILTSKNFWRYLIAAALITFCIDSLLQHRNYFGFIEFRPFILVIMFPLFFLSTKNHNEPIKTAEEKSLDLKRWEIRNLARYEFIIILLIIFLFVPLTFFGQYTAFVNIIKGSIIMLAIGWLLKKNNNINQK